MEKALEQLLFTLEDFLWMWGILQMGLVKDKKRWTLGGVLFMLFLVWEGCVSFGGYALFIEIAFRAILLLMVLEGNMREVLLKFVFSIFAMDIVGGPIRTVLHVIGRSTTMRRQGEYQNVLYEVILIVAIIMMIFIMQRHEEIKREIKKLSWHYYVIGVFVCFMVGLLRTYVYEFGKGQGVTVENFAEILCTCLTEGVYFLAMALVVINEFRKRYQEESSLKSENMEMLKEYHRSQEHHMREVRKIQHDIQNHLLVIEKYLEQGKINETKEYLNQVAGELSWKKEKMIDVGNDVASAILSREKEKTGEGTTFHCEGRLVAKSVLSDYDVCIILSNLLENAREACEKLREKEKKITILLKEGQGEAAIIIKNPVEWDVDVDKLGMYTTKKEKRKHGYGLSNVMETVERYNGEIKFRVKDGEFSVCIRI